MIPRRLLLAALLPLAACTAPDTPPPASPAPAAAAATAADPEAVHRFRIGQLEAVSLRDGGLTIPNDNKVLGVGRTREEVAAVLARAGVPTDTLSLNVQTLLVRSGEQLVMLDSGGGGVFPGTGELAASLAAAGVRPEDVTDIVISHSHGDHVGGLTTDGALTYPNARIHLSTAEWAAMTADNEQAERVALITPKVVAQPPGARIAPGLSTFAIEGHSPGHIGVEIASAGERVLYVGDSMHHYVVSVAKPDWRIAFDGDAPTAERSRRALLQRAADERLTLFVPHFPFPGRGTIRADGDGFVWVPAG